MPERPGNVDCDRLGVWKASTQDLLFSKVFSGVVQCLTWTEHGLYACSHEPTHGFEVGLSRDGGKSFAPLMKLRSVEGLACPSPSMLATACAAPWRKLCPLIGTSCNGAAGAPAPIPPASPLSCLGDAGFPATSSDAGRPNPLDAAADAQPDSVPSMPESQATGCGCSALGTRPADTSPWPRIVLATCAFILCGARRKTPARTTECEPSMKKTRGQLRVCLPARHHTA